MILVPKSGKALDDNTTWAIIDMAKNGASQGMPIDLSSMPPNYDHCALGKQSKTSVPKL